MLCMEIGCVICNRPTDAYYRYSVTVDGVKSYRTIPICRVCMYEHIDKLAGIEKY